MVALRLDSFLARRSGGQWAAARVHARQKDDDDILDGRQAPPFRRTIAFVKRDDADDKLDTAADEAEDAADTARDESEDDDDSSSSSSPTPSPSPSPPAALTTSSSTTSTTSSESDTDTDSSTSSTSTSASTTLSIPPILTSTLSTSTSIPQITPPPQTNLPLLTSSLALPTTTTSGAIFIGSPGSQETGRQQNDRDGGPPSGLSASCKAGIALGVLAGLGLIVGVLWGTFLIRRRRRRHGQDELDPRGYPSRIGRGSRFDFNLPSMPALPSSLAAPLERFYKPKPEAIPKRQVSNPFNARHVSGHRDARSDSDILNEAIQAAYQMEDGRNDAVPQGFLDEKRRDPNHLLPLLDPAPVEQAHIRKSVVSWFKRSSRHHPLKLNPASGSGSLRSSIGSNLTGGRRSRPASQATQRTVSYHSNSGDSAAAESSGARRMQDVPPLPDLGLQKAYTNNTAPAAQSPTESTAESTAESVTAPLPVFTRDDAQAYYKSMLAGSSVSGSTERMSAMSSWTDVTRTTMAGGRSSAMPTPGLSPPPSFHSGSNRTSAMPQTPITPGYTTTGGENTRTGEDMYALYAQTRGSVAGSAVGLGLQQQQQQQQQSPGKPAGS
ncbi:hypothetical protein KVR01_002439 [Diaporthe batatas]|uniref:uncharacterized protein n=1 Tax=Diaporthe batatas TaxID=748121 RepID=UPI001D043472|nr:uncharacterized protein KVR01_002439 [Diaporthe batatas]KAG8166750.1 hypothetical protein KVR01_002439 [Diaporthe batatas]